MSLHKHIKTAADTIDSLATDLEKSHTKIASLKAELAKAKGTVKSASDADKVKRALLAKTAAAALKTAGLLSSDKAADIFASTVLDHDAALSQLTKLASVVSTARATSRVVVDTDGTKTASANDVFASSLRRVAPRA